ncbi:protein serine/threonine phosphatase 2C [Thelephora terrestris]|uniref:Protein serine/threonine phosphatase 2C n=1 Tax=Thelephora terrestris TaxID=56493 RepID=A0A9P6HDG5_9AGAM|nr:protein serine/threonine phosphatase 2C [Thelephora terrestris]
MEDSHTLIAPFNQVHGQGFFSVFDGHAGKHAAEWCGQHFHEYLEKAIKSNPTSSIPDILNQTFHDVDSHLSKLAEDADGKMHSGCTAVTAFLRIEDPNGKQVFLDRGVDPTIPASPERTTTPSPASPTSAKLKLSTDGPVEDSGTESPSDEKEKKPRRRSRIKNALKSLSGNSNNTPASSSAAPVNVFTPTDPNLRRVLYCANAGDARGVLCRGGVAIRLTYDHKGSDKQEAKRIMDAGGFVMSGRVNGVLAVTRSLGDSSMKEFVVGAPYTTETALSEEDEFIILACDGLWDIAEDKEAVDHVRYIKDPKEAVEELVKYAKNRYSNDNVTVVVIRLRDPPEQESQ